MSKYLKFLPVVLIIFLLLGLVVYYKTSPWLQTKVYRSLYPSFCDLGVAYKIGSVDPKFDLSKASFSKLTNQAAKTWNHAYGEPLFRNDPAAKLTVNLVFDERQGLTNQIGELSTEISKDEEMIKPGIQSHEQKVVAFGKKLVAFEDKVNYWNARGGAPEEDYQKLLADRKSLQAEADALNAEAKDLNQQAVAFNAQVSDYNSTISEFNTTLKTRPEEGLFDGPKNTISVYFYITDPELLHTLIHEFGHALGMNHTKDEDSIMFSKTNKATQLAASDLKELGRVCKREAIWDLLHDRYF